MVRESYLVVMVLWPQVPTTISTSYIVKFLFDSFGLSVDRPLAQPYTYLTPNCIAPIPSPSYFDSRSICKASICRSICRSCISICRLIQSAIYLQIRSICRFIYRRSIWRLICRRSICRSICRRISPQIDLQKINLQINLQ